MNSKYLFGIALLLLAGCRPSPDKVYAEANAFFAAGNYKDAVPLYEELQVRDANNVNIYPKLTISYASLRDWSKCADYAKMAIERQADFFEVYQQAVTCQLQLKKPDQALSLYYEALKKYPDRDEMKEDAAVLEFKQKHFPQAVKLFQELAKSVPENPDYAYNAAATFEQIGKPDMAEKYYKQVIQYNPMHENAFFGLGNLAQKRGDNAHAIEYYQKALKIRPDHQSALLNLAQLQEKSEPQQALKHWKLYLVLAKATHQDKKFITKAQEHIRSLEGGSPPTN